MPYCPRCGVDVGLVPTCPLCATPIPVLDEGAAPEPAWPSPADRQRRNDPARRYATATELQGRAFLAIAAVFATAALAVLAVDGFVNAGVTWSRYPLVSLAGALALIASGIAWRRRPASGALASAFATLALLAGLDVADGRFDWFPGLGLPLTAVTVGLGFVAVGLWRLARRRGYNLFGGAFALVVAQLLAIDALVTTWATGTTTWGWSLVAALVLLPLAVLFFLLHLIVRRTPDLRRTFHF